MMLTETAMLSVYRNSGLKIVENFRLTGRFEPLSGPGPWGFSITSLMDEPALPRVCLSANCPV